jgi:monoamine oxidase
VTIFEARDHVGGRVASRRLENGSVVELGAEFVLPGYEVMNGLVERLGLRLFEKGTLYGDREPRGGVAVTRGELDAAIAGLGGARGSSLQDAIERLDAAPGARAAIASRLAVSTAYELDDQAASVLADGAAGFGRFPSHGVVGGNDAVARALADPLDVRLGSHVSRVEWRHDGVEVAGVRADACILAVPAPGVLEIELDPPLPAWKQEALAAVRYGAAAKLFLPLEHPVEPSATLSVPGRFWTWTQHDAAVASSFAGTAAALERLEVDAGPDRFADAVRRLRPDLPYADGEPVLATWPEGAYSARSLASPMDDEALARNVGRLFFAGEHTAGAWHALMEGALRTGLRAAAAVTRTIRPPRP